jgi:predicted acyltransferase
MPQRLLSLDVFRGLIIAFMVIVNTAGTGKAVYPPLRHARWDGWTPTDVVFPSFVWIVGVAISLSLGRKLEAGADRRQLFLTALRRAAILFALGLLVYLYPKFDFSTFRILGVLQRIAICYLATVGIFLITGIRGQIAAAAACLIGFALLMFYAPVPGYGAGYLDVERNFAHYIDRIVLGAHNYGNTKTWDPEGVVSTLPAIGTCLIGLLAGHLLAWRRELSVRTTWMLIIGNVLIAVAFIWDASLPINKSLWTSSFVLLMAGLDFVMFGAILWLIDGVGYRRGLAPLVILGKNAIAVYMTSELVDITLHAIPFGGTSLRVWLYETWFAPLASPMNASLLYAITYMLSMLGVAYFLHRRGWFLRA